MQALYAMACATKLCSTVPANMYDIGPDAYIGTYSIMMFNCDILKHESAFRNATYVFTTVCLGFHVDGRFLNILRIGLLTKETKKLKNQ